MVAGGGFEPPISRRGVVFYYHRSRGISARAYEPRGISGHQRGFVLAISWLPHPAWVMGT